MAGVDTVTYTSRARISHELYAKLDEEKRRAQTAAGAGAVYCPEWLGAKLLPNGAKGYSFLIETEDFTVKIAGEKMLQWPGVAVELRSYFLHTHEDSAPGAIEASLAWVRQRLLVGPEAASQRGQCTWEAVTPSRFDLHIDWQGGFEPTFDAGEVERFVKPRRLKWHPFFDGRRCTGYRFGSGGPLMARLYNKTVERKTRQDDAYFALLAAWNPKTFDPERTVWRLEFQIRREGLTGFHLAPDLASVDDEGDDAETRSLDAQLEEELSAEDLLHIGTFPKLFTHSASLFDYLMTRWLRLTTPSKGQAPARWPMDPTWETLRLNFARLAEAAPLDDAARALVRAKRYEGRRRLLRRLMLGFLKALEERDASVASASLAQFHKLADRIAHHEAQRLEVRQQSALNATGEIPDEVATGMGALADQPHKARHLIQTLLGICASYGVLPLELRPVASVADLLVLHLDALQAEADEKGGIEQVLADHFAKVYKLPAPSDLFGAQSA
jgi:hypothetical protein